MEHLVNNLTEGDKEHLKKQLPLILQPLLLQLRGHSKAVDREVTRRYRTAKELIDTVEALSTFYIKGPDGKHWGQVGCDHLNVTESGTYTCDRPGSGRSPPVRVVDDELVLQMPAWALLEGDTVTLRCRGRWNSPVPMMRFYQDEKELTESLRGTELSLSPLQRHHSGHYRCEGFLRSWPSRSAPVTVTVHVPVDNATMTPGVLELTPWDTGTHRDAGGVTQGHQGVQDPWGDG
ncbi:low affinity immunoglobulin gamma Fc region receptor III-like [Melospiza melodia melodia]|uniref:low affinity immunoglobulin gamma Fc region receptor III-like n=1 Tax=Melospiza melodia melodia TaxID=1914991 RepID=UPI002FD234C2